MIFCAQSNPIKSPWGGRHRLFAKKSARLLPLPAQDRVILAFEWHKSDAWLPVPAHLHGADHPSLPRMSHGYALRRTQPAPFNPSAAPRAPLIAL